MVRFTTLTESATKRLRDALGDAVQEGLLPPNHGLVIKQYKESNDPDWNVLVCHPRSLTNWSFERVAMIAIDEATSMLSQIGAWENPDDATRQSLNGCVDILRKVHKQGRSVCGYTHEKTCPTAYRCMLVCSPSR